MATCFVPVLQFGGPTRYHAKASESLARTFEESLLPDESEGLITNEAIRGFSKLALTEFLRLKGQREHTGTEQLELSSLPATWSKRSLRQLRAALELKTVTVLRHQAVEVCVPRSSSTTESGLLGVMTRPTARLLECSLLPGLPEVEHNSSECRLSHGPNAEANAADVSNGAAQSAVHIWRYKYRTSQRGKLPLVFS